MTSSQVFRHCCLFYFFKKMSAGAGQGESLIVSAQSNNWPIPHFTRLQKTSRGQGMDQFCSLKHPSDNHRRHSESAVAESALMSAWDTISPYASSHQTNGRKLTLALGRHVRNRTSSPASVECTLEPNTTVEEAEEMASQGLSYHP